MANAMRKMAEYLGLVDGDGYNESYDVTGGYTMEEYAEYEEQYSSGTTHNNGYGQTQNFAAQNQMPQNATALRPAAAYDSPAAPVRTPNALGDVYRITTLHPHTYNDARRIGEEFRNGTPVIMNLGDMDDADARRIVDFSAGLAFGLHGSIEKVAKGVFLLSPANVDIGAAARAQLREDPFFNQS
jgi:cell division inhibitor SepF